MEFWSVALSYFVVYIYMLIEKHGILVRSVVLRSAFLDALCMLVEKYV
jgi:hypothetical protein